MKASTGFLLTGGQAFFAQPLILNIYGAAPEPESANDAASGVLLVSIKDVHFVATGNGYRKAPGEIWSNETTIEVSADATYFRLVTAADHGEASTTFPRLQGSAGTKVAHQHIVTEETIEGEWEERTLVEFSNPDLYLINPTSSSGQTLTIDEFKIAISHDD